jgi:hypothetical protein
MVRPLVVLSGVRRGFPLLLAALVAGCGGDAARQDADEPTGRWTVDVEEASFPRAQHVSRAATLRIRVRNEEDRAIPNVAVTVEGFGGRSTQSGLSDANRPVFIVDRAPTGGTTAYTNTWALGRVPRGGEREFVWRVTPVEAGRHEVRYRVAAGLDGKAVAQLPGGRAPAGRFRVTVSGAPADARVDPETGDVIRE